MDKYSLNARIYPMAIFLFPIIVIGVSYSIQFDSSLQALSSLGVSTALIYLLSNLGRDKGKLKEPQLWRDWGGAPTSQMLSLLNNYINPNTKSRYHQKLGILCPIDVKLNHEFEREHPDESIDIYKAWTNYLISQTRDSNKFSLVFKENISYGFRRNLWGLKSLAISLILISFLGSSFYHFFKLGFENFKEYPIEFFISETVLLILLFLWVFVINKNWIKIPAFAYSERLLETIEMIDS